MLTMDSARVGNKTGHSQEIAPGATRSIPVARGTRVALVDADMHDLLSSCAWWLAGSGKRYAYGYLQGRTLAMHRVVAGAQPGQLVDHIDGDTLHNTRANLRLCTSAENRQNSRKHRVATSRFRGVCFDRRTGLWKVGIGVNSASIFIGRFATEIEAAAAYNAAASELHGAFACLNEIVGGTR
jgi:hypothetical protein